MYRIHPYYCFFALQLPSWTNLKIENRHVHIFSTSCLYVSYLSTCMYISTYYISCSKKCLYTIPIQLHHLLLQSFLLFFFHFLFLFVCAFFFFFWSVNSKCCIWNCLVSLRSYYKSYVFKKKETAISFQLVVWMSYWDDSVELLFDWYDSDKILRYLRPVCSVLWLHVLNIVVVIECVCSKQFCQFIVYSKQFPVSCIRVCNTFCKWGCSKKSHKLLWFYERFLQFFFLRV